MKFLCACVLLSSWPFFFCFLWDCWLREKHHWEFLIFYYFVFGFSFICLLSFHFESFWCYLLPAKCLRPSFPFPSWLPLKQRICSSLQTDQISIYFSVYSTSVHLVRTVSIYFCTHCLFLVLVLAWSSIFTNGFWCRFISQIGFFFFLLQSMIFWIHPPFPPCLITRFCSMTYWMFNICTISQWFFSCQHAYLQNTPTQQLKIRNSFSFPLH